MESWELRLRELMELAQTDVGAASIGVRELFREARDASRTADAIALAGTLQVLLDAREWYEDIAPFVRAQPPTARGHTSLGFAEEQLGMFTDALDSYARALVAGELDTDRECLEIAAMGIARVLARTKKGTASDG